MNTTLKKTTVRGALAALLVLAFSRPALQAFLSFSLLGLVSGPVFAGATPAPPSSSGPYIGNIHTRILAKTGDDVIVTEFVVQGTGTEYMILRGIGPTLGDLGVPGALQDPTMRLFDASGRVLDSNDNWVDSPDKDEIVATGLAPAHDSESAIVHTFAPGLYTVVVRGVRRTTGVALPEVYRLSTSDETTAISGIGTRGRVSTGDHVIVSGVDILGTDRLPVLVRALGPSLADFGISRALADPALDLYDANGTLIASNDNWKDTQQAEIEATGLAPDNDLESATILTAAPGAYTAVVRGVNDITGTGFVQFYSLHAPVRELNPAPKIGH